MKKIVYIIFLGLSACNSQKGVAVKFKNESREIFNSLEVNIFGTVHKVSNLPVNASSPSFLVDSLYRYHYAKVITATDTMVFQPIDFVGETVIKRGRVTLGLRIDTINGERRLVFIDQN
jgi:hypothetical protein